MLNPTGHSDHFQRTSPLQLRVEDPSPHEPAWLEVDLDAVADNVRAIKHLVGASTGVMAVVKAQAYGLGGVAVARAALAAGASWLAVARVEEAVELRQAGIVAPILQLAYAAPDEIEALVRLHVVPAIADLGTLYELERHVPSEARYPVHLKVDTGLSRFGVQPSELIPLLENVEQMPKLHIDGLFSHLATADEADTEYARSQLDRFQECLRLVRSRGHRPRLLHLANSAGTLALPEARLDLVRIGITLSGHYPGPDVPRSAPLTPAVSLKARLARVYDVPSGASVGYGRTFVAPSKMTVGLVPVGYADGLPRAHSNRGYVLIRGQRAPLVGRVSMDQCAVDLTACGNASPGDEVVVFGRQNEAELPLDEFAAWSGTIAHEALCRVGPRVRRWYRGRLATELDNHAHQHAGRRGTARSHTPR